jgi:hypothetical protein
MKSLWPVHGRSRWEDGPRAASRQLPAETDPALARSVEAVRLARRQALASLAAVAAGTGGSALGARWGPALLVVAAAVEVALLGALALARARLRERARESIIAGTDDLRVPAVARERLRLVRPRTRRSRAASLEDLVEVAERWQSLLRPYRPVFDPRLPRATAAELRTIARLLRAPQASAASVALTEKLLTSGSSPLYGDDVARLRAELDRILRRLELDSRADRARSG